MEIESSANISNWLVEGVSRESQEDGVRSRPTEGATGPIKKIPHRGRVTVWLSPSVPCGLGFQVSNFRIRPDQRREEVQLYSAHWWRPADWGRILSHQECCRLT